LTPNPILIRIAAITIFGLLLALLLWRRGHRR
jgi:hypothetical protein